MPNLHLLQLLFERGADPNARNNLGLTPQHIYIYIYPSSAAKYLLEWATMSVNISHITFLPRHAYATSSRYDRM
jgi:ankyrin repeat protein